jgi:F-type H+-transporting ATPase subunit a
VHVNLAAEKLGTVMGMPITNTLLTSVLVSVFLMAFSVWFSRRLTMVPSRLQSFFEAIIVYVQNFVQETLEDATLARKYFPLLMTSFLFIALCNLAEFIPGVHSVQFLGAAGEYVPFLRGTNTDLNMTLALTLVVVFMIEAAGIMALGFWHYMHKFFTLESPIKFFVGIVEFVSELARIISFSFRLFGNIFAGQVLIAVVTFFVPVILPAPLMLFEMFVGVVQAAIFTLLTLFFIKLAVSEVH